MFARMAIATATLLTPIVGYAGVSVARPVPTLGEAGLIVLGIGLVGFGIARLRKR